ncbi:MAG: class I SAM-dependent methyltransferase [Chitinophagaceae bacterium]
MNAQNDNTLSSKTGEAWGAFFNDSDLSWCIPDQIESDDITRFAHSAWIQRLLNLIKLPISKPVHVLEAGCGTAMYSLSLATLGFNINIDAFDYNPGALVFAYKLMEKMDLVDVKARVHLGIGNLLSIEADTDTYDLVFNQAVLEYFVDETERQQALTEMVRVTKPGGWVAVITQHTAHPFTHFWQLLGWKGYTNQPAVTPTNPQRLRDEFSALGLQRIAVDGINPWKAFFFYPAWYKHWRITTQMVYLLGRFLERFVPLPQRLQAYLAIQIIVVGQKL